MDDGLSGGLLQALRGRAAIGADEAADAEFDAAEPTRNHDDRTVETLSIDGGQDGFAGAAGGLAIVVEAVGLVDAVGSAMATAAVVAQAGDKRHGGFGRACRRRLREEAALLDFDRVRARSSQRDEGIRHGMERGSVSTIGKPVMKFVFRRPSPHHYRMQRW